jgi:hypothetical protein
MQSFAQIEYFSLLEADGKEVFAWQNRVRWLVERGADRCSTRCGLRSARLAGVKRRITGRAWVASLQPSLRTQDSWHIEGRSAHYLALHEGALLAESAA